MYAAPGLSIRSIPHDSGHPALVSRPVEHDPAEAYAHGDSFDDRSPAAPMKAPGFQVLEELSHTPLYSVYRACRQGEPARTLIIKELAQAVTHPEQLARFRLEYEHLEHLSGVNGVIRAEAFEQRDGIWFMVFEDIHGRNLERHLTDPATTIDFEEDLELASRLCEVLANIHASGIVHRDIRPSNIVWNKDSGELRLVGFGASTRLNHGSSIGEAGYLRGSLEYISPEQSGRMNRPVDYRTDIYSLGVTLYRLLTGYLPFYAQDALALVHAHIAKPPRLPHELNPELPVHVSRVLLKMLEKHAENRYQNGMGAAHDFRKCMAEHPSEPSEAPFSLGERDIPITLRIPQKLYGRTQEAQQLIARFEDACQGLCQLVLVSGHSGVGKTALIQEVKREALSYRGEFVSGKFDQLSRGNPYSAFIQALKRLVRQLLGEPDEVLDGWRRTLQDALEPSAQAVIDVVPELELILGPQPKLIPLGPTENANRFRKTFKDFLDTFISREHPLILFLDDLQWADLASLEFLSELVRHPRQYLMVIGSYRNNEITPSHIFSSTLQDLRTGSTAVTEISLKALEKPDVVALLQDTLSCDQPVAERLASICIAKTKANPYFLRAFLTHLYQTGVVRFDSDRNRWTWSILQIKQLSISRNVAELIAEKIVNLAANHQEVIHTAACIGSHFELQLVARARGLDLKDVLSIVEDLVASGLLVETDALPDPTPLRGEGWSRMRALRGLDFRFAHDRVQQAALALLSTERRREVHLAIGSELLRRQREDDSVSVFRVADQLNQAISLIGHPDERTRLAELNREAGVSALRAMAYDSAVGYLNNGLSLLDPKSRWRENYQLTYDLLFYLAQAHHLAGRAEVFEDTSRSLLDFARDDLDRVKIYPMRVAQRVQVFEIQEAIALGLEGLQLIGFPLPRDPSEEDLNALDTELRALSAGRSEEDILRSKSVQDPRLAIVHELLGSLHDAAYIGDKAILRLIVAFGVTMSLRHGNHPLSALHFAFHGALLATVGNGEAMFWGSLAKAHNEREGSIQFRPKVLCLLGTGLNHHFEPVRSTFPLLKEAVRLGQCQGDYNYATYSSLHTLNGMFLYGTELSEFQREARLALAFSQQTGMMVVSFRMMVQLGDVLTAKTPSLSRLSGEHFCEEEFLRDFGSQPYLAYDFHVKKSLLLYLAGEYEAAYHEAKKCARGIKAALDGVAVSLAAPFYFALAIAGWFRGARKEDQPALREELSQQAEVLRVYAARCEENYLHAAVLAEAELGRVDGNPSSRVLPLYERALKLSIEYQQPNHAALAAECALRYALELGVERLARTYYDEAKLHYARWGATAKLRQLETAFPHFTQASRDRDDVTTQGSAEATAADGMASEEQLDLQSLMKASSALANEVNLEQLLSRVMTTVIENAGAERGALMLVEEGSGELRIQACGSADGEVRGIMDALSLSEHTSNVPVGIVQYVARKKERVVLDNAPESEYGREPYIYHKRPKSLICLPILNQMALVGVLYLEHRRASHVFNVRRLSVLELLSTQVAISIQNARHYRSLEDKVEARTLELAQKAKDLEAAVARAEAAVASRSRFLANMSHEIRTPMNGVIGLSRIMLEEAADPEQKRLAQTILSSGETLLHILNDILDLSKMEAKALHIEARPVSLIDLSRQVIELLNARAQERQLELELEVGPDTPPWVNLDGHRLRQVLSNLIGNGIKFTQAGGVRTAMAYAQGWVRVEVSDTGIGMAAHTLKRIFEPFEQAESGTARKFGGTGLGLTICRELCELMGGRIRARSELGKGSTFIVELPAPVASEPTPTKVEEESRTYKLRVLVAEDNQVNQMLARRFLTKMGVETTVVGNGAEAVEAIQSQPYDLVLMDLQMPEVDGLEATRLIRALPEPQGSIPVVALTASVMAEERETCLNEGMNDVLSKPLDLDALERLLRSIDGGRRSRSTRPTLGARGRR